MQSASFWLPLPTTAIMAYSVAGVRAARERLSFTGGAVLHCMYHGDAIPNVETDYHRSNVDQNHAVRIPVLHYQLEFDQAPTVKITYQIHLITT